MLNLLYKKYRNLLLNMALKYKTPLYVYFEEIIYNNVLNYLNNFNYPLFKLFYAYKANTNYWICKIFKDLGLGADVVSLGEIYLAKKLNLNPNIVLFTSNGKIKDELNQALKLGYIINIDNFEELKVLKNLSFKLKIKPKVSFRINLGIESHTHDKIKTGIYTSKFGIIDKKAIEAYKLAKKYNFEILGIHSHIGSQILEIKPFEKEVLKITNLVLKIQKDLNINLKFINLGGGIGIDYYHKKEEPNLIDLQKLSLIILSQIKRLNKKLGYDIELYLEPGRSLIGNAGILLAEVLSIKESQYKNFINVDTGFHHLIRPAMYDAYHYIVNLNNFNKKTTKKFDIAGTLCESGDILGKDRNIYAQKGDILAILDAGAYGFSMASNYNLRPKPAEILILKNNNIKIIRPREDYKYLLKK